jgi:hypothetical protein
LGGVVLGLTGVGSQGQAKPRGPAAAASPAAPAFAVATRIPRPADNGWQQRRPSLFLGEGWACASFASETVTVKQCWDAGPHPRAWKVPTFPDAIYTGCDRICAHDQLNLTFRCWQRPRRGELALREMPPQWQWLNPNHTGWDNVYDRSDRLEAVVMGPTVACLQTTRFHRWFCLGDDRFGQLGGSSPPSPDAAKEIARRCRSGRRGR